MKLRITIAALVILLLAAIVLTATVKTRTEITGTGAAVQVASSGSALWVQVVADPGNSSPVRLGDSTVTATSGVRVAPGGGQMLPYKGDFYTLSSIYVYVANGDKVSVIWSD